MDVMYFKDSNERDSDCIQRKVSNCNPSHSVQGDDLDDLMMTHLTFVKTETAHVRVGRNWRSLLVFLPTII